MIEYLFSYGILQKEKIQLELFGRVLNGAKDGLRSYQLSLIEIKDPVFLSKGAGKYQKTLIATKNSKDLIDGTAFEITSEELLVADKYEPVNYKRDKVTLESGKEAWIYVASEAS